MNERRRTWCRLRSRSGHLRRSRRSDARNTRFWPSRRGTASRTSSMHSRKKTSNTPAGCDVTAIPSLFSSNGYLSNRSRRRRRHHDHLQLALITRPQAEQPSSRTQASLPTWLVLRSRQGNLQEISSSASCVAIEYPITLTRRHTAIESNLENHHDEDRSGTHPIRCHARKRSGSRRGTREGQVCAQGRLDRKDRRLSQGAEEECVPAR